MVKCNSKSLALQYTRKKKVQNRKVVVTRIYISKWSLFRFAYGNTNKDMSEIPRWKAIHVKPTNERAKMFYSISQSKCAALDDFGLVFSLTIALNVYVVIAMNDRWHSHDVFIIFFCCCCKRSKRRRFISILFSFRQHWFDITKPESGVFSHSFPKK